MPIYEYKCAECGHTFSVLQPAGAPRTGAVCACCGGKDTKRVLSVFTSSKGDSSCTSTGPFT